MTKIRHTTRAAVYVILEKDNRVLLIRRFNTGYRDGEYTLPAGHVDPNETYQQTGVREALEEVCVTIKPEDLSLVHVMQRHEGDVDVVDFYFRASAWTGEPRIGEPHKADDLQWVPVDELADRALHFIGKAITRSSDGVLFSHDGVE